MSLFLFGIELLKGWNVLEDIGPDLALQIPFNLILLR